MAFRAVCLLPWQEQALVEEYNTQVRYWGRGYTRRVYGTLARYLSVRCQWYVKVFEVRWDDGGKLRWYASWSTSSVRGKSAMRARLRRLDGFKKYPLLTGLAHRKLVTAAQAVLLLKYKGIDMAGAGKIALDRLMEEDHPVHANCDDELTRDQRYEAEMKAQEKANASQE